MACAKQLGHDGCHLRIAVLVYDFFGAEQLDRLRRRLSAVGACVHGMGAFGGHIFADGMGEAVRALRVLANGDALAVRRHSSVDRL